jgi:hypothetical protein
MLIKVTPTRKLSQVLASWIDEIEDDYMDRFEAFGPSLAHLVLDDGPWDFALLFPGSTESAHYLEQAILGKDSDTEILTMPGRDLDDFRGARQQQG